MSLRLLPRRARRSADAAHETADPPVAAPRPPVVIPSPSPVPSPSLGFSHWRVWGTTVTLGVQPAGVLEDARLILEAEIGRFDLAASRFRADSELGRLNAAAGLGPVGVSGVLFEAVRVALGAAATTGGAVDPTVGAALVGLGYDRDYDELAAQAPVAAAPITAAAPGWRCVALDERGSTIELPAGVALDLGATAKALCADRAAAAIAADLGCGALVDLGGDLAIAGPPPVGGWRVGVTENARDFRSASDAVVAAWSGGVASSSTSVRTWERNGVQLHHIVDPSTGMPAEPVWRLVTVAASSCVAANTAATAAVVWGDDALFELAQLGLPARFVRRDGEVIEVGGWPPGSPDTGDGVR